MPAMPSIFKSHYRDKKTGQRRKSKNWHGQYTDEHGATIRVSLGTPDKAAALAKLGELVKAARRRADDGYTPGEMHRRTSVAEHLEAWEQFLIDGGATARHARQTAGRVRRVLTGAGAAFPRQIDPVKVARFVSAATFGRKNPRTFSDQTRHDYLRDCRAFTRWLVDQDRTERDWLAKLKLPKVRERRHARRALTAGELRHLLETTRASQRPAAGLSGTERWALYLTAMTTGFRVQELASLAPAAFDAAAGKVGLRGSKAKNRRAVAQRVPAELFDLLRDFLAERPVNSPLWPGPWWKRSAEMLRPDLQDAGILYVADGPDGPLFADFHALRHSYITLIARATKNPKLTQEFARHASPVLTLAIYTHVEEADRAAAMDALPRFGGPPSTKLAQNAATTGPTESAPDRPAGLGDRPENGTGNAKSLLSQPEKEEEAPPGFEPGMADLQFSIPFPQAIVSKDLRKMEAALAVALAQAGLAPEVQALVLELVRRHTGGEGKSRGRAA